MENMKKYGSFIWCLVLNSFMNQIDFVNSEIIMFEWKNTSNVLSITPATRTTNQENACPQQRMNGVIWPSHPFNTSNIPSNPLCLDEHKYLLTRHCASENWEPEIPPSCSHTQLSFELSEKCPLGYTDLSYDLIKDDTSAQPICMKLTHPQSWANECMQSGSSMTIFDLPNHILIDFFNYLNLHHVPPVWLPAIKSVSHRSPIWFLAGHRYSEILRNDKLNILNFASSGCVRLNTNYDNEEMHGTIINCLAFSRIMCLYHEKETVIQLACPDGWYTTRYYAGHRIDVDLPSTIHCYTIQRLAQIQLVPIMQPISDDHQLMLIDSVEKTVIYQNLAILTNLSATDRCVPKFTNYYDQEIEKTLTITQNQYEKVAYLLDFVNWANNASGQLNVEPEESGDNFALTVDEFGKWHWSKYVTCFVDEMVVQIEDPRLSLHLSNKTSHELHLYVYQPKFLWRLNATDLGLHCFTNYTNQLKRLSIQVLHSSDHYGMYNISNFGDYGQYWCEGISIKTYNKVVTDKIFTSNGEVFAILVQLHCTNCSYESIRLNFEIFLNTTNEQLNGDIMTIQHVAIVNDLSATGNGQKRILFHVTVYLDDNYVSAEPNNLEASTMILYAYNVQQKLREIFQNLPRQMILISLRSTKFCLPISVSILNEFNWVGAEIGETVASRELCLSSSGMPVLRKCAGNKIDGAVWLNLTMTKCDSQRQLSPITMQLYRLNTNFNSPQQSSDVLNNITNYLHEPKVLLPVDVFFVSEIMTRIGDLRESSNLGRTEMVNLYKIYNRLMSLNTNITQEAAQMNSTNSLLIAFENVANTLLDIYSKNMTTDGILIILTKRMITVMLDPTINNITGIGLFANVNEEFDEDDLNNYNLKFLLKNQSIGGLMYDTSLEIASFIPESLLEKIIEPNKTFQIKITVFINDILFRTTQLKSRVNNKIISISIASSESGESTHLPERLPNIFKSNGLQQISPVSVDEQPEHCGFWDFTSSTGWSGVGCKLVNDNGINVHCACQHMTNFAFIIHENLVLGVRDEYALNLITMIGCSLSLLGIFGIYLTAVLFKKWRTKLSTQFLLQFSSAIALQMIMICFINTTSLTANLLENNQLIGCIALGALLHYAILVVFVWMLIIAYLQFMRYVIVFKQMRTRHFLLKSSCFGWGAPMVPVLLVIIINPHLYLPREGKICYPRENAFYFASLLPIATVMVANMIIFSMVLYHLHCSGKVKIVQNETRYATMAQLRLSIFLFFLLGVNWVFGFMASDNNIGLIFSYLFCLSATSQGLVLFLYFILFDPIARNLWSAYARKIFNCKKTGKVIVTDEDKY